MTAASTFVVAGNGRPHALVGEAERARLFAALNGAPLDRLDALAEEGLIRDGQLAFIVAEADEAAFVRIVARRVGRDLADRVEVVWPELEATAPWRLNEQGFLLVGNFLLDQALLDALALDDRLMPPAPQRRSGRYYAWLVEGGQEFAGHYGQRITFLQDDRLLLSFGRYEDKNREVRHQAGDGSGLPVLDPYELRAWEQNALEHARTLVDVFPRRQLHDLAGELRCRPSLGELVCWFDHLAYAHAIDLLAERLLFPIPASGWTAVVTSAEQNRNAFASAP